MAAIMDTNDKEENIRVKLSEISLEEHQKEATAFLCAALAPFGKVYGESERKDSIPSIPQCYRALKEEQKIQPAALNLLFYILNFVGWEEQSIDGQETTYKDIDNSLSVEERENLKFFQLLYKINNDLSYKDKGTLIYYLECCLDPPPSQQSIPTDDDTDKSLFVYYRKLIDQEVISTFNMLVLYHWLALIGMERTLNQIDVYNNSFEIPVLNRFGNDIPRLSTTTGSPSVSAVDFESANALQLTSATSSEPQNVAENTPLLLGETRQRVPGNTTDPVQTAALEGINQGPPAEREVDVKISHPTRFSPKKANLDTAHLAWTFTSQTEKVNFTLESDNGEKLYTNEVESGNVISEIERGYRITVSAMPKGGQAIISNLQPGISYTVVIEALNENVQCTGRNTASVPSTATGVPSTTAKEAHCTKTNQNRYKQVIFILLVFGLFAAIVSAFGVYNFHLSNSVIKREIQGNNTIALKTTDAFKHCKVEVSQEETQNPVEIFSASAHCNRLNTGSRSYSYSWQQDASFMNTYGITTDYFAVGSKLMFQANITAKVDRFNCSSAIYIFDDSNSYKNFLGYELTRNSVGRLCFNLSQNGSYYNQVQSYSMKESSFLYIGLYLPPISIASHVDLSICGTQNFYIVADLTSHCILSATKPTCKFTLSTNNDETSNDICILGRGSSSNTEERVVNLKFMNCFPNGVGGLILIFLFLLSSAILLIFVPLILIICKIYYFCYHRITKVI